MARTFNEVKSHIIHSFLESTNKDKEKFCKNFALMARFAGWRWGFSEKEISYDQIYATYERLVSACYDRINAMSDDNLRGTNWTVSSGTGRINISMTYYVNDESVMTHITADIS
jgi:hypothetical protein